MVHARIRKLANKGKDLSRMQVFHERNLACCRAESWMDTAGRITKALADDGLPVVWALVNDGELHGAWLGNIDSSDSSELVS